MGPMGWRACLLLALILGCNSIQVRRGTAFAVFRPSIFGLQLRDQMTHQDIARLHRLTHRCPAGLNARGA